METHTWGTPLALAQALGAVEAEDWGVQSAASAFPEVPTYMDDARRPPRLLEPDAAAVTQRKRMPWSWPADTSCAGDRLRLLAHRRAWVLVSTTRVPGG